MKIKVLITGCAGYIGSIATDLFLKKDYQVVGVDNFQTGYRQPIEILKKRYKGKFKFYEIDLKDNISFIFEKEKGIEVVVHYAASCVVDESMKNPYKYFQNNPNSTLNLVETMNKYGLKKIVFSSTCALYGEAKYVPIDENHPTNPNNVYGESKLMAEKIIQWYGEIYNFNYIIFRYFNVSGATEDGLFGYSKNPSTHLTENAVKSALGIAPFYFTYQKTNTPDGSPIRDYINVLDLNEAHILGVKKLINEKKFKEIINLGTGTGNSVLEIVDQVKKITGKNFKIKKSSSFRQGEAPRLVASIEKAKRLLNWQSKRKINDSIETLIKWYIRNPNGWNY